jgi:hypothetical protein
MRWDYLFYTIGIIFLFATVAYFSYNFVFNLPDSIKLIILILMMIIFFVLGDVLEERQ